MSFSLWNDEQDRPIQHLRIIDMTVMLPGPYLTRVLSQYGADVIKVEALPNGDPVRALPDTSLFELLNRGKRSIGVNLKHEQGISLVRQLAGEADVFIENFREGVLDSMGLGYSDLSEENPDLLYLSVRGLSRQERGPRRPRSQLHRPIGRGRMVPGERHSQLQHSFRRHRRRDAGAGA